MNQIIQFIYGGKLDTKLCNIRDAKQVCTFIPDICNIRWALKTYLFQNKQQLHTFTQNDHEVFFS